MKENKLCCESYKIQPSGHSELITCVAYQTSGHYCAPKGECQPGPSRGVVSLHHSHWGQQHWGQGLATCTTHNRARGNVRNT